MEEEHISVIMEACVILHNMIIEDWRDNYNLSFYYDIVQGTTLEPIVHCEHHLRYEMYF